MLGIVDTFTLEISCLLTDVDTLLNNPGDSAEATEFSNLLIEGISQRINTISFCISKMYEESNKIKAGDLPGRDVVTGFVRNSLTKLVLQIALSNNKSIGVMVPVISKLNSEIGLNEEFNKLLELVKQTE